MVESIELIVLSFLASLGFAIVFQLRGKNLIIAAAGGAIVRTVYSVSHIICRISGYGSSVLCRDYCDEEEDTCYDVLVSVDYSIDTGGLNILYAWRIGAWRTRHICK